MHVQICLSHVESIKFYLDKGDELPLSLRFVCDDQFIICKSNNDQNQETARKNVRESDFIAFFMITFQFLVNHKHLYKDNH